MALLLSGSGAALIDLTTQASTPVQHSVDMQSRSFQAQVPRPLEPAGSWTVRLAAALANAQAAVRRRAAERGALPGQPNVYDVTFRTSNTEPPHLNFWSGSARAAALASGDVSKFAVSVSWDRLAAGETDPEPIITGPSTRWYVSSVELGQGVATDDILSTKPQFLGRVQPYSICLPSKYGSYAPGRTLPLTLLLHSLSLGQSQFAAIDPRLLHEVCERRDSVVVTPLARGPSTWYFDTGELDVWEVWARVAEQLGTDPNRTVISGYSMGGYAAYKLGLSYPQVFSQAVVLAGPPACGVRLLPDVDIPADLDPDSPCAREGDTWKLLVNARWLPYVIAHGLVDELVPIASAAEQVLELDRLGYRHRFTLYPLEDHLRLGAAGQIRGSDLPHENRPAPSRSGPHHVRLVSAAGAGGSGYRSAPGVVVVGADRRSRGDGAAWGRRRGRRAVVCPAGPHAHHSAPSRCLRRLRANSGPLQRAGLAGAVTRWSVAISDAAAHRRRRPRGGYPARRVGRVAVVDDHGYHRHRHAHGAQRAARRRRGATRRSAVRGDRGRARGASPHHAGAVRAVC